MATKVSHVNTAHPRLSVCLSQRLTLPTVVDSEGNDVDSEWVETSNGHLAQKVERRRARPKPRGKRREPAPPTTLPPVEYATARRSAPEPEMSVDPGHDSTGSSHSPTRSETVGNLV